MMGTKVSCSTTPDAGGFLMKRSSQLAGDIRFQIFLIVTFETDLLLAESRPMFIVKARGATMTARSR